MTSRKSMIEKKQAHSLKLTACPLKMGYPEMNAMKVVAQAFFRGELIVLGSVGLHNSKTKVNLQRVLWP